MKNYIQPGVNLTIPAPADLLSGEVVVIGELVGIAATDAASGADLDIVTEGVFELPKVSANVFAVGDPVYYASATKLATSTVGTNTLIGVAVTAAPNPSGTVNVKLG
ncbi:DUF2190 family protein [Rhodomicrobium lacus]|uniref:DUF2190 family protein n=1 Tax=Rhodomicrobium lacus TaxID=2498452 RepID=UPI0026E4138D|nr:capsid cement protein [Rhodomicrobium lacus]WKW52022.1 DUF2190 family protein [Rhodomicrobium lacus]